jgi:hypothetical protein
LGCGIAVTPILEREARWIGPSVASAELRFASLDGVIHHCHLYRVFGADETTAR